MGVLSADGKRQAEIIASRGLAAAGKVYTAEAEAAEIKLIKEKVGDECRAVDYISGIQWLKTLVGMTRNGANNNVVLVPVETVDNIHDMMMNNDPRSLIK